MSNVDPQEVEALMEQPAGSGRQVSERDFGQPLRLGAGKVEALRRRIEGELFRVSTRLGEELAQPFQVDLADVREVHADAARAGLEEPIAALRFHCAGQVGWAVWDNTAAVGAIETLLCGKTPDEVDRGLSSLEQAILLKAIGDVVRTVAEQSEVEIKELGATAGLGTFGTWHEAGSAADPHRVVFDLTLNLGEDSSELHVYLPGLDGQRETDEELKELPGHLDVVDVELSARLGEIELPLSELLGLENGDVVPLGTPTNGTLAVTVDGWEFARARLGKCEGRLAISLTEVNQPGSSEPND